MKWFLQSLKNCCLANIFYSGSLPLRPVQCLTSPLLLLLSLYLKLSLSICHHPIQHHLSWSSFCCLSLHISVLAVSLLWAGLRLHFLCLALTVHIRTQSCPLSSRFLHSFICMIQLIFSTPLHVHTSKTSGVFTASFLMVYVSDPYSIINMLSLNPSCAYYCICEL